MRLAPVELRGEAAGGRSRPLRVQCKSLDGIRHEVILKLRDPMVPDQYPWELCLSRELMGAILLRRLGFSVPDYAVVDIDDNFVRASSRSPHAERIRRSLGPNFGSLVINNVYETPSRDPAAWSRILTVDALAFNADRKPSNPNVLWNGETLFAIDHGLLAPTWTAAVDGLTGTTLYGSANIHLHAAFPIVQGKGLSFDPVWKAWDQAVDNAFLTWAIAQIPADWANAAERTSLKEFLGARRHIGPLQVDEIKTEAQ